MDLEKHINNVSWSCKNCHMEFHSQSFYNWHLSFCVKKFNKDVSGHKNKQCQKKFFKNCVCGKPFHSRSSFFVHKKRCKENGEVTYAESKKNVFKACKCGKSFFSKSTYYNHKKNCCSIENEIQSNENYKCQEENCSFSCHKHLDFLNHIKNTHSIDSCWEVKTFEAYEEFEDWKEQFEKLTTSAFTVSNTKKTLTETRKLFVCNRSGTYVSRSTGKRALKTKGLSKIGFNCTACIKVQIDEKSRAVKATICKLHYGHDKKLFHLRIPKSDRALIANQLAMGIEHSQIQKYMFSEKQNLVTIQDIKNISRSYGLYKIEKHPDDHLSACQNESIQCEVVYDNNSEYQIADESYGMDNDTAEYQKNCNDTNSESQNIDKNYICGQLTETENTNLSKLKSKLLAKTMALYNYIQNCDSEDLLLTAKEHIDRAFILIKAENKIPAKKKKGRSIKNGQKKTTKEKGQM